MSAKALLKTGMADRCSFCGSCPVMTAEMELVFA